MLLNAAIRQYYFEGADIAVHHRAEWHSTSVWQLRILHDHAQLDMLYMFKFWTQPRQFFAIFLMFPCIHTFKIMQQ